MGDPRQAIDALNDMREQNFVLLLHVGNQLNGLRKRLVAFGQLFEALIDIHLTYSISEAGYFSGVRFPKAKALSFLGLDLIWATSYSPTHSRVQYHRG